MFKEGDRVLIKDTAPKCSAHRGLEGEIKKKRPAKGPHNVVYIVKFSDGKSEIVKEKDLQKIDI